MLERLLSSRIRQGTLRFIRADGKSRVFGSGAPEAVMRMRHPGAAGRIARDPEFMLGQVYMDEGWDTDDLRTLLNVLMLNFPERKPSAVARMAYTLVGPLLQWNRMQASRRNAAHHYDLDEALFRSFLDEDMQYSCAYFGPGVGTLEEAQREKCRHIMRKLYLQPGQKVLDIGCGWGGLPLHLAEHADVSVTGLTLSREQARVARDRVAERGLEDRVKILVQDYREHHQTYDRIVSVGMFEHVGTPYYGAFFAKLRQMLSEDGVALLHTIGKTRPKKTNAWLRRYIFPGGYVPALSEIMAPLESSGLVTDDVEILRMHYAETLAEWQRRFQRSRREAREIRGERFCRMWEFYLAACEATFRWRELMVFQLQLTRRMDVLPLTRDYLYRPSEQPVSLADRRSAAI